MGLITTEPMALLLGSDAAHGGLEFWFAVCLGIVIVYLYIS